MTENISNLIVAAVSLCGGIVVAILAGITIWTFRDIRSRTRDPFVQILATVMVGVIPVAGILVYFMLRPRETLSEQYVRALEEESLLANIENQEFCPTCGRRVEGDMQFCPSCHTKLRNQCGNCGKVVHLSWDLCPYCGSGLTPEVPAARVTKPQPKQMASPKPQQVPGASVAALEQPKPKAGMLDRMGIAIGGVVDKMASLTVQSPPMDGQAGTGSNEEIVEPPVAGSAANRTNGAASSPPPPKPSKKPAVNREELE
jgi:RNA polymerase subunit RPABC4/transcription elongation factor Spt4